MWTPWKTEIAEAWKLCMAAVRKLEADVLSLKTEYACGQNSTVSQLEKRVQELAEAVQQLRSDMPCSKEEFRDADRALERLDRETGVLGQRITELSECVRPPKSKKKRKYVKKNAAYWEGKSK